MKFRKKLKPKVKEIDSIFFLEDHLKCSFIKGVIKMFPCTQERQVYQPKGLGHKVLWIARER